MSLSLRGELLFLALSLLFGILLGLLYDLFRFLRALLGVYPLKAVKAGRAAPVPKVITFFLDTLYMLSSGVLYIVFVYALHSGIFRFYSVAMLALGAFLYLKTLSRVLLFLLLHVSKMLRRFLSLLLSPFWRCFCTFLRKMHCFLRGFVVKYKQKQAKRRTLRAQQQKKERGSDKKTAKKDSERIFVFGKAVK